MPYNGDGVCDVVGLVREPEVGGEVVTKGSVAVAVCVGEEGVEQVLVVMNTGQLNPRV